MSDVDLTRDSLEHADHVHHNPADSFARRVSLLIGVLAAFLALAEMAERSAQNEYLSHHIAVSDEWTFYGFKSTRARIVEQTATILGFLPDAAGNAAIQAAIEDARHIARRERDGDGTSEGTKQIESRIHEQTVERDRALHRYELYEMVTGALQIAIVLASVSIVTRIRGLAWAAGAFGAAAGLFGGAVRAGWL